MTPARSQLDRQLIVAPLHIDGGAERLGRALWLYVHLIAIANHHGQACKTLRTLGMDLFVSEGTVHRWLDRLVAADLVEVISPSPYLVLKLRSWPSNGTELQELPPAKTRAHAPARVSSSKQQQQAAAESNKQKQASSSKEDGGVGEGETLIRQATQALGATDSESVASVIASYPVEIVRKALLRAQVTPTHLIRKSRLALFRFLLKKLSAEASTHAKSTSR